MGNAIDDGARIHVISMIQGWIFRSIALLRWEYSFMYNVDRLRALPDGRLLPYSRSAFLNPVHVHDLVAFPSQAAASQIFSKREQPTAKRDCGLFQVLAIFS